jgi:hypothetical protein
MEELIAKLNSLKGQKIDDATIAELLGGCKEPSVDYANQKNVTGTIKSSQDIGSVDDLVIASRAAELEMESMRRYFKREGSMRIQGLDGLADEPLSSESEDEILPCDIIGEETSRLDKILAGNSLEVIPDDDETIGDKDISLNTTLGSEEYSAGPG